MLHDQQLTETATRLVAAEIKALAYRMSHLDEDPIRRLLCEHHCDGDHYGHRPGDDDDIHTIRAKARGNIDTLLAELGRYARARNVTIPEE